MFLHEPSENKLAQFLQNAGMIAIYVASSTYTEPLHQVKRQVPALRSFQSRYPPIGDNRGREGEQKPG